MVTTCGPENEGLKKNGDTTVPLSSLSLGLYPTRFPDVFKTAKDRRIRLRMSKPELPPGGPQPDPSAGRMWRWVTAGGETRPGLLRKGKRNPRASAEAKGSKRYKQPEVNDTVNFSLLAIQTARDRASTHFKLLC